MCIRSDDRHGPADVDHTAWRNVEPPGGRSNTATFGQGRPDTLLHTTRDDGPADPIACRQSLRLPVADRVRQLGAAVIPNGVEHHRGGGAGCDVVQMQSERRGPDLTLDSGYSIDPTERSIACHGQHKSSFCIRFKDVNGFRPLDRHVSPYNRE
jgi:hypothetical protein